MSPKWNLKERQLEMFPNVIVKIRNIKPKLPVSPAFYIHAHQICKLCYKSSTVSQGQERKMRDDLATKGYEWAWQESLEIARQRFKKFNSNYIESIIIACRRYPPRDTNFPHWRMRSDCLQLIAELMVTCGKRYNMHNVLVSLVLFPVFKTIWFTFTASLNTWESWL
jgi:hypothetical protein